MTEHAEGHQPSLPDWAEQERAGDLAWLRDNVHIFWPAAQIGYQTVGRGAIVVDTTTRPTGAGHPFGYLDQEAIEQSGDEDAQRLVREYEPDVEFVTTLLKTEERASTYHLRVLPREELGEQVEKEQTTPQAAQPPDLETLRAWEEEGHCEATDGCVVEPDGTCSHGYQSWLLELGLI
jgi:hypothetical protein